MSWLSFSAVAVIAVFLVVAPGVIVVAPSRASWLVKAALAGPISVAIFGFAGVVGGVIGVRFGVPLVVAVTVLLCAGAWGFERFRRPSVSFGVWARVSLGRLRAAWRVGAALVLASAVIVVATFALVGSPALFPQTYDNIFHINGVLWILNTGDASSLHFREIIEPAFASFYPSAWHSFAALVTLVARFVGFSAGNGVLVPAAMNAAWIAIAVGVWLPGIAWLTRLVVPARDVGAWQQRWLVPLAVALGAGFAAMPYGLLSFGSLSPMFVSYAATPVVLGLVVVCARRCIPQVTPGAGVDIVADRLPAVPLRVIVVWLLLGVAAIVFSQPRSIASAGLLAGIFGVAVGVRAVRLGWSSGPRARRTTIVWLATSGVLIVGLAGVAWYVVYRAFDVAARPIDAHLNGPQATATQGLWDSFVQVVFQLPPLGVDVAMIPAVGLTLAVLLGLAFSLASREVRWVGISAIVSMGLYLLAAGSNSVIAKLATGLWYKDRFRLSSLVVIVAIPVAALGVAWLIRAVSAEWPKRATFVSSTAVILVVGSAFLSVFSAVPSAMSTVFARPAIDDGAYAKLVDQRQVDFLSGLPSLVPAGQRVLGDPWDGSSMSWLFGGREPVFPHVNGQWDADRSVILSSLPEIGSNPAVCAALGRLNVHYVLFNPVEFGGGDPAGNVFGSIHAAVEAGVFTDVVATNGPNVLYRITQCP